MKKAWVVGELKDGECGGREQVDSGRSDLVHGSKCRRWQTCVSTRNSHVLFSHSLLGHYSLLNPVTSLLVLTWRTHIYTYNSIVKAIYLYFSLTIFSVVAIRLVAQCWLRCPLSLSSSAQLRLFRYKVFVYASDTSSHLSPFLTSAVCHVRILSKGSKGAG